MARIVVTGASGFIGTRLVERLRSEGHEVTVLLHLREAADQSLEGLPLIRADVTQPESLQGKFAHCDTVFHLAGCTIARSRADFFQVNHDGTANVARACAEEPSPPKLLFVSSLAAAGPARGGHPLAESAPAAPVSDYGRSKWEAEKFLLEFSERLPIQIVRPPAVMGEADPHMLGLFKTAKAGWVFTPGWTPFRYSMIHVDDLVRGMIHVASQPEVLTNPGPSTSDVISPAPARPGLVHLSQSPPMTFPETARVVRDLFGGGAVRTVGLPKSLCWLLAGTNSLAASLLRIRPLLNLDKMREAMAGEWMADSTHLTEELGFEFPHTLEERIRQTAEGYQRRKWL